MRQRVLAWLLALTMTAAGAAHAAAQTAGPPPSSSPAAGAQEWQGLSGLKPGKKILVEFKSGVTVDGKFVGVAGERLTLSAEGSTHALERSDIRRVYLLKGRWSRRKAARVGAVAGMLLGTVVGAGLMVKAEREPGFVAGGHADTGPVFAGMFVGAAAGAGAGALVGGKRAGALLYESK
jgi:hypothetical protein